MRDARLALVSHASARSRSRRVACSAALAVVLALSGVACRNGEPRATSTRGTSSGAGPRSYDDVNAAARDLVDALRSDDVARLRELLGPNVAQQIERSPSDDADADQEDALDLEGLALATRQAATLDHVGDDCVLVRVGTIGFPLPVSIVRRDARWTFAGVVEQQGCETDVVAHRP